MKSPIAIAGSGSIGVAFAILFATAGFEVRIWDAFPEAFQRARADLKARLAMLEDHDLIESSAAITARIIWCDNLDDAVTGVSLVQECIPEQIDLKREIFARLGALAPVDAILASSTSALTPSLIAADLDVADRIIVAHPGNPPYLLRLIELVASPSTDPDIMARAKILYEQVGLHTVTVKREVEGFVFNRLQGAVLREAYCLVRDGVASVDDIDAVMRSGLGPRWSVIGPFETVDLNTRGGIASHALKMGPAYARMGEERGQRDPWTASLVEEVTRQRREQLPLDAWEERVRWRDEQLMRLCATNRNTRTDER